MLMENVPRILIYLCFILASTTCINGSCTFPSQFQNSSWWDSTKGLLTFTVSNMSGWKFDTRNSIVTVSNWECWDMTYFQTDGYFIIKSTDAFKIFGTDFSAYLCLKMTKVTDYSYYYYQQQGQKSDAHYERVYIVSTLVVPHVNDICSSSNSAKDGEFHVLLKQGRELDAKRDCPTAIRGNFDYVYYDADSTTACNSSSDYWAVCNDGKTMTFNYSTCNQRMAYSAGGIVWCIASVTTTSTFVVLYNNDASVDDVNTFRFSCVAVSSDSSKASMISNNCELNQTSDTIPTRYSKTAGSFVSVGARLSLTAYVLCPAVNCDYPGVYRQSSWVDSGKGEITFKNKSMSGWTMTALGQTLSNWECWNDTLFDSQGYLLLRSIDTISSIVVYYTYMCMKLTKVTDYSYYYYLVHARDTLAGQERVLVTNNDSVSDFSMICDTTAIEPTEQFHMLVKSGYQEQAKQDCPNSIRGNFDYVYYDANGATFCPNTSDKWQVCIDNKTMTFDYTTCSQLMAYSADGFVWCMASVTKTNTYVMVYNNDTTVNNSNTYRFSCFAISQSSNSSSLSPRNCSESQTPETFPKDQSGKNTGARLTMAAYASCISQENTCTFPSDFRNSVWQDSTKGDISFTNSTMSGWDITIDGHTVDTWKCLNDSWFDTKGILVLKLQDTISGKVPYYAYMCMKLTKMTANSYYYYLVHAQEPLAAQERLLISVNPNVLDADTVCDWGNIEPIEQFHVLLRSGYEASSKQDCPDAVLGNFDYIYYRSTGSVACQNSVDKWEVCKDNRTMNFNYTTCSQRMAYSAGGTVWCVGSISSTYTYVVVYNNDSTVDDLTTFRFTCFVISSDGKNASMVPRNCTANQTPYEFPRSASGSLTGAKLYMTAYASCFSKERTDACEFATKFQNSTWRDSTKGDLSFSKTTMAGWSFMTEGRTVSNWRCFGERLIESQTYLILKLTDTISAKVPLYAYLCLRMTHQSDYSVYYYQVQGQEYSAGQERLLLTTNSSVPDTNQMCDTSSIEPTEQFHVMLKSGYESTAKQKCPNAIRGNFDYVYYGAGGSVACNTVNGKLEVCTDNKTMVFNYTRCNQTMAYSSGGKPWCVASVTGKHTYVVVYNNDSTVNGAETRRFSCFAISNDGKNATMVSNNCTEKQTPYEFPKSPNQSDTGAKLYLSAYGETSVCSFPDSFKNTVWHDSTKGDLTFTNSSMSGWSINVFGQSISNWECYDSSYFATYGYLVFRSTDTISSSSLYYAYLCMRLTRVSDYSYYYYVLQAQVYNAGQERVYLSTDYSVSNFSLLCDTRNVEPLEQFHMLIRSGYETVTKQNCPNPIRGNFEYVYFGSDGTTACTAAGDSWNVCIDNQTMYFNYTSCSQRMAYSDRGIVWCVAAVSGTYTYVMLYNNDTIVDQNSTHRFSCLTINSNGTSASHVPRNCTQNQTPDTFAVSNKGTNTGYKAALNARATCREESKCNLPNNFINSVWHDSTKGDLQFTNTSMYGWSITVFGQTVRNWECLNSTLFDSDGYLIFRLMDTVSWNVPYYAYMCMKLTQVTDYSYYYYLVQGQTDTAGQERILVCSNGSITDFTSLCALGDIAPAEEFHVLLKSGFESSAKRDCPNVIRGNFDYVYYGSDGTTYCSSSNDQGTVCRDNKTMTFNYTTCNKTMAYSSGGNVWCIASVNNGYTYLIVYNNDTYVDDVETFRFTCIAISSDGKNASVVPRNCSKGQTPYSFAKGSNGFNVGAKLTMTAYQTCAAESTAVNLPTEIKNSLWYDGTKGNITFSDKGMMGWGFTVFGHRVSNWELIGNYLNHSGYWIFRLTDTISGRVPYYAYLCIKPTKISNYSYYYYQVHAQQSLVEGERILLSTNGTISNKDQICDSANIEPTEQFHILVKTGNELNARQDCPNPLRGKFKYTYNGFDGNVACKATNGELDVCTNIQIMSYNYSKCSQQVAYSVSGNVWCMASVTSGHSYSIVYNTDSSVDDNSTFRFSCIAVSSDNKNASVVPRNCRENQTPFSFAMTYAGSNIGSMLTMTSTTTCGSTSGPYSYCVFPSQFMNSAWHDSTKGDLTFTNNTMSGWKISTYGHTVTNWKCWDSTLFQTHGYLVMKLSDTISAQTPKYAYMCMKLTKLSDNSYYYYLAQAQNPLAGEERILISENDTVTDISILCNIQNLEPKEQFHVLVKQGYEEASKQNCPNAVRGNFDYTYRGSDNVSRCESSSDRWTVCQDNQTLTFDYSTCSQKMAYSNGGIVWCVASIIGSYTYVMVYNNDSSVDNVNTFRFTCFAVTNNGTFASMAPRNCTENQSPTALATSQNGSNIGATLTMSAYASCREDNACSLPSNFRNSIWHDSTKGDLTFTNSSMQGWPMTSFGHTGQNWECWNSTLFSSQGYLIFRLSDTISGNVPYYGYMCMRLTKVSDYSYYYYLVQGPSDFVGKERIFITTNNSVTDFNSLCVLANIERAEQFHALIKSGFESSTKHDCPNAIRGNFDYVYYGSDGSTQCSSSNDQWMVCRDNKTMTFNYTTCNQTMAYSRGGNVWCVAYVISAYTYVMAYNNDTIVDDITTFRFTCFAISSDGRNASMVPRNCSEGQTPFNFAKSKIGLDAGAKLTMSANATCAAESSTVDLPADFQNSSWYDGTKGKLQFTNNAMTGWNVTVFGHTVSAWELIGNNFVTDDYLLFRLTDSISGSVPYYAYLCMKPTRISNYSYYYYQVHAKESSVAGERILLSTNGTFRSKDQICDSANIEPTEQFHILVKTGYELNARQDCPNPLRGKFMYVYYGISVNVACASTNGELDVCSNIQIMSFNYSKCSQQVAYTASGKVWCMASVTSGYSYTIVYNTDSNVDDNSTFKFSCLAISSDSKNASVVPKNCRENQTPYSFGKAPDGSSIGSTLIMKATAMCGSTSGPNSYCEFPSQFLNSVWHDSTKGNLTFTNTTMSGWSFSTYGHTVTNWNCWESTRFETQGYLVMKLSDTISAQTPKFAYMCMKMTKLSNNSYYYYLVQAQNPLAGEERILISDNDTLTDISILCNIQNLEPKEQFHVLVKKGFEEASKQDCPNAVRGNFDYTYSGSDNVIRCQSSSDRWTVCQDNQTMTFDYLTCSQKMAYSNGGVVWCVASVIGSYTYVMVYNNDSSVDNVNTFRFTCFAVTNNGTSASMVPHNCTENQRPTAFATSKNGSNIGATLTMSAYVSCREGNTCSLPSNLQNSIWHDSTKGDLSFTNASLQGWSMTVFGHTVQNWECWNSILFTSQGYLIFRLSDTISGNIPYYGYMCMKLTKVSDYSYYYYLVQGPSDLVGKERISITTNDSVTDFNSICVLANIERAEQFHVLIKSGSESSAKQDCPNVIRGNFDYVYYGSDGSTYCSSSNDQWMVCRDNKTMTFNYTTCNRTMAYSDGGNVWCVAYVVSGHTYVMVYNNDTNVNDITTFRFTCFVISNDGKNASMVPRNCSEGQTPFSFAKDRYGLDAGAKLTMSAYATCAAESSAVDLPADFQNSIWYDGSKGKLTFSNKTMTGWNVTVFGHAVSAWELVGNNFLTDDYLMFRLTDTISGRVPYYAYLCMKPTKISNYSYYYYQVHAKESTVEGERILLTTDGALKSKDQICDSANIEPTEQFHILVKTGYELNARQDCPNPLRGKFMYVYYGISVNVACASTNGELDVCSNIQTMSFNYSKCSQQVAYTANGKVWCMASVTSDHSYTIVYNTDSNVDDNSTFRFSCIAVSSDSKNASVVPKHCRENQTPYSFGKAQDGSSIGSKLTMKATDTCGSTSGPYSYCEFPNQFLNSQWHDSTKGSLTFTNTTMSGWAFATYGHTVKTWKCWDATLFETQGYLVLKLADTISAQTPKFAYMCMKMTKLSNNSYYYYLLQARTAFAGEERILISDNDTLTDIGTLCDINNIEPKEQFHVLIKSGFEKEAMEDCPNAVRGNFDYTYYGSDGSVKCQSPNDQWTVCRDNKTMIFNYSTCSQQMAYSSGGVAWCVASIIGTNTYVMVYNNDSFVDNVNTFRFACFAVLNDGTSASMTPRNCTENQSPTVLATSQNGSKVGALLTMTAYGYNSFTSCVLANLASFQDYFSWSLEHIAHD